MSDATDATPYVIDLSARLFLWASLPVLEDHRLSKDCAEAAALIRSLREDNARLEADMSAGSFYKEADADWLVSRAETAEAALATERATRIAAEKRAEALEGALTDHNDLLRSALQIAKREGVDGQIASTNWDAYYNRVAVVLKRHHEIANSARATLKGPQP